jgi:hypothetical protein
MCLREMMNAGRFILNVVFVLLPRVLEETLDLGVGAAAMARLVVTETSRLGMLLSMVLGKSFFVRNGQGGRKVQGKNERKHLH